LKRLLLRLPPKKEVWIVLLSIIFPVHFWAMIVFLRELPSYLFRMKIWDILGVLAYTQLIALVDSLLLLMTMLILAFLLPRKWFLAHFSAQALVLAYTLILIILPLHILDLLPENLAFIGTPAFIIIWAVVLSMICLVLSVKIIHSEKVENACHAFQDKISVVSLVYLAISLTGLLIIIGRNLGLN
jgi:hypothetical protein